MRKLFLLPAILVISFATLAQQVHPENSATIYHELLRLNHLANVLYLAAHPDDENTGLLTWLEKEENVNP